MSNLNHKEIRNLLTIRYNPESFLQQTKSWTEFKPKNSDPQGKKTEKLLKNAIKRKFENIDDPIVFSLSSGIDSSLCLSLIRNIFPEKKLIAICGVFKYGFDESIKAKKIAKQFDADFHTVKIDSMFTNMPELISITKRPRWNTYQHLIAKKAKNLGSYLVTGDGADEIYGGYTFRYEKFLTLSKTWDNWKAKTINYLECHNRDWVPDQNNLFSSRMKFDWNVIYNYFRKYFSNRLEPLNQLMLADYNGKLLCDFIPTGKMIYSFHNIDNFPLFLQSDISSFGLSIPTTQKFSLKNKKGKLLLRKIAMRHKIQHVDDKKGFSPNLFLDWKDKGETICKKFLLDQDSFIYSKKLINDLVELIISILKEDNPVEHMAKIKFEILNFGKREVSK